MIKLIKTDPDSRRVQDLYPEHYDVSVSGAVRRTTPKLRGKAAVKAAKRRRQAQRM